MARQAGSVPVLLKGRTGASAGAVSRTAVAAALAIACLALLLTAPAQGDFWWSDAPRHALNGVFVRDFIAAHPIHAPSAWAIDYYLRRPALTILFYPPVFYLVEAMAFALFGVSHFVAQSTVALFTLLLGASTYTLSRLVLPRWSALGAALLVIGGPETALWGRQVMLDVPAYALAVSSACCLAIYLRQGRKLAIYLTAAFLLAAIYTKYNAVFIAPALAVGFLLARGREGLRDRHAIAAVSLVVFGLLPAVGLLLRFGAVNRDSVAGLEGTLPLDSLACWLFYARILPEQLGWAGVSLGIGGILLVAKRTVRSKDRWACALLLAWLTVGYAMFSLVSVKEPRHSIMLLLPLAIGAPVLLLALLPKPLGESAGLALGAGTLAYTLIACPVPRVTGFEDVASYLARNVPRNGAVLFSGYRDANLIFDLAALPGRSDIALVRVDKLLLTERAGERRRGVTQSDDDETAIMHRLRDLGASYLVVQPGFWTDLAVMRRFEAVADGPDYVKVAHFPVRGDLSTQDGVSGIDILQPTYPIAAKPGPISIDMPLAGQHFDAVSHP